MRGMNSNSQMLLLEEESRLEAENEEVEQEAQLLDLINRVQMFQIASSKVNQSLLQRKKKPVITLHFTEKVNSGIVDENK